MSWDRFWKNQKIRTKVYYSMPERDKLIYALMPLLFISTFLLFSIFQWSGAVLYSPKGFAADEEGRVFLAGVRRVYVIENGEVANTLSVSIDHPSGIIASDGNITVYDKFKFVTIDSDGQLLAVGKNEGLKAQDLTKPVMVGSDKTYFCAGFLRYRILENGRTVYSMPTLDFIALLLLIATVMFDMAVFATGFTHLLKSNIERWNKFGGE